MPLPLHHLNTGRVWPTTVLSGHSALNTHVKRCFIRNLMCDAFSSWSLCDVYLRASIWSVHSALISPERWNHMGRDTPVFKVSDAFHQIDLHKFTQRGNAPRDLSPVLPFFQLRIPGRNEDFPPGSGSVSWG